MQEDFKTLKDVGAVKNIAKATSLSQEGVDNHLIVTYQQFDSLTGEQLTDKTMSYSKAEVDKQINTLSTALDSFKAIRAEFDKNHKVYEPVTAAEE